MSNERIYRPLPHYDSNDEIRKVLKSGTDEELMLLSLSVGQNHPDWKFAQDICLVVAESSKADIRANACLGLAYVARTKGRLEKHIVKPILLRELHTQTDMKWRIINAIEDINLYLGWNLALKHLDDVS